MVTKFNSYILSLAYAFIDNMEKLNKIVWDSVFRKEGKVFISPQEDMTKTIKLFKKFNVKRVLDLGCGSGRHLVYLAKHGFDVYGFDIAKHGIKIAREWLKKEKFKSSLKVGDIYGKLPYGDNFFDAIISVQSVHHGKIEWIRKCIKEMKRILKPDGLVFITVRKHVAKKYLPKDKIYGIKYIAPRTYIILGGQEKGMPHYRFNKKILRKEFNEFKIRDMWIDSKSHHYCLLAQLINKHSWKIWLKIIFKRETVKF